MEIERAFKRLLVKSPFYGLFCLSLPKEITTRVPTLCVMKDGISCRLCINPEFWKNYTDDEQISLLEHELSHIALQHMFLSSSFSDPKLFNVSADCEVNSYIENLPKDAMTAAALGQQLGMHLESGLGTKKYYEAIQSWLNQKQKANAQNPQKPCNSGQGGNSSQQNDSQQESQEPPQSSSPSEAAPDDSDKEKDEKESKPSEKQAEAAQEEPRESEGRQESEYPEDIGEFRQMDSHSTWKDFKNLPEANKQLISNNINSILKATAEQVEKSRGTIPANLVERINKLREKRPEVFNWKAYFRRMLGSIYDVNIRSTRRKESKRFAGSAGIQHKKKVSILVAVDTSGSVSQNELLEFFSEIDYVYKAGARVTIIQCDTRINSIEEYDGKNIPEIKGRGGTEFEPPVNYYIKHRKEYASLIYFTDGEAPLPRKKPSGMVWVISSCGMHQDYPGKTVYIPRNNN